MTADVDSESPPVAPIALQRLRFALPPIAFGPDQVQVLRDESGRELDDIRTLSDNQLAAPYLIHGDRARPKTRFGLRLDPEAIRYAPIDAEGSPGAQPGEPA